MIVLGLARALGLRGTVILACLLVLLVTAYGVAQDLGLLERPAHAAPARKPAAGQPTPSRAAVLDGLTGRPSTRSMSTPRQRLWLETRRVPLTYQEWPVRRHDTRIRWRSAAATSSVRTRRSSRGDR